MKQPPAFGHIDSLDGLRGLAAAVVLIGHVNVSLEKSIDVLNSIRHGPLAILINGYGAVHLFFILSGFCLASSAARCTSFSDLAQYYVRRVFRIHPPYMFALLATWGASFFYDTANANGGLSRWMVELSGVHISVPELLRYLCYPGTAGKQLPVAWSMAVEMLFSILLPLMMLVTRRVHWAALLAITAYPIFDSGFQLGILKYGVHFTIGIILYEERARLARVFARLSNLSALAFSIVALALFGSTTAFGLFYHVSGQLLSVAGGTALICCALFVPRVRGVLASRPLVHFGKISYSFYLFHFTVLILFARIISGPASLFDVALLLTGSFVATTLCAELAYRVAERPAITLGNAVCRRIAAMAGSAVRLSGLTR